MEMPAVRIALIHSTALAIEPIAIAFERHWPRAQCMNLLDDSLAVDRAAAGGLTPSMSQRFVDLAGYAKSSGCSGILFTCSAFGSAIEAAQQAVVLPILKPNEAMFAQALGIGPPKDARLGLVATFEASLGSMSAELMDMARKAGRSIDLRTEFVPDAMKDLAQGRVAEHHQKVAAVAGRLRDCDAVMLAQFSMAAAQPVVQAALSCPVLSSPDCAVLALRKRINNA